MLIAGLVVFFLIVGMFLQAVTTSPKPDSERQIDTDEDVPSTPVPADEETHTVTV